MDPVLANCLMVLRNQYAYPKAYIDTAPTGGAQAIPLQNGRFGIGRIVPAPATCDLWLDNYHNGLIASGNQAQQFLALASIVYWGFANSPTSHNKAMAHARWFVSGKPPSKVPNTPASVHGALTNLTSRAATSHCGSAVASLASIGQLGQLPFASKVVAFAAPAVAGVYDNRINEFLRTLKHRALPALRSKSRTMPRHVCRVAAAGAQATYERWCTFLRASASYLNALGAQIQWQCTEVAPQSWRAVDVERAIFRLSKMPPTKPLVTAGSNTPQRNISHASILDLLKTYLDDLVQRGVL